MKLYLSLIEAFKRLNFSMLTKLSIISNFSSSTCSRSWGSERSCRSTSSTSSGKRDRPRQLSPEVSELSPRPSDSWSVRPLSQIELIQFHNFTIPAAKKASRILSIMKQKLLNQCRGLLQLIQVLSYPSFPFELLNLATIGQCGSFLYQPRLARCQLPRQGTTNDKSAP